MCALYKCVVDLNHMGENVVIVSAHMHTAICDFLFKGIEKTVPPLFNVHISRFREFRLEFPTNDQCLVLLHM